jgi:hypothetical protein
MRFSGWTVERSTALVATLREPLLYLTHSSPSGRSAVLDVVVVSQFEF